MLPQVSLSDDVSSSVFSIQEEKIGEDPFYALTSPKRRKKSGGERAKGPRRKRESRRGGAPVVGQSKRGRIIWGRSMLAEGTGQALHNSQLACYFQV